MLRKDKVTQRNMIKEKVTAEKMRPNRARWYNFVNKTNESK